MAFRSLVFSKSPEANTALAAACKGAGMRAEICTDIFAAIEKGTKQSFSCILADWSDQPEAGFLLKRARESGPNKNILAIAIVDVDPTAAEIRDNRLDFLIYRPIAEEEACDVLLKATEKMQPAGPDSLAQTSQASQEEQASSSNSTSSSDTHEPAQPQPSDVPQASQADESGGEAESEFLESHEEHSHNLSLRIGQASAAAALVAAAFFLWNARATIVYLAQTRENRIHIFQESLASLFYANTSGAVPVTSVASEAQQDAYFSRGGSNSSTSPSQLAVVSTEADLSESRAQLPKPPDFPLPTPVFEHSQPAPVHVQTASIPESLRTAAPITPPVVVTVNPALMPVSAPAPQPLSAQQFSEPVAVSETSARSLLMRSVNPAYPAEALPQKLHGLVVLEVTIGRDGLVEDLKMVRGNFILAKAAVAAVKQWRFQPYTLNGHAAETQTVITINFTAPPA